MTSPLLTERRHLPRRSALLALTAAAASACGQGDDSPASSENKKDRRLLGIAASQRKPAPAISGETLAGDPIALADFRGDVVVINVWGSWCAPCRGEAPHLRAVYEDTRGQGVAFLGINTREASKTNALNFEKTYGITYPSLWDPAGRQLIKFKGTISPSTIPSTVIIDRKGRIAGRALKAVSKADLRKLLDPVLKEG